MDKHFKKNQSINGYKVTKRLGEGRYGIAYLATNEQSQKVVIKQLKKDMLKETRKKLFYEENIFGDIIIGSDAVLLYQRRNRHYDR